MVFFISDFRAERFALSSILTDLKKASVSAVPWCPPRLDALGIACGTLLGLPHTLLERSVCSGCLEDASLKEGFTTALPLP